MLIIERAYGIVIGNDFSVSMKKQDVGVFLAGQMKPGTDGNPFSHCHVMVHGAWWRAGANLLTRMK
jgi:hypothetical protein